MLEIRTAFAGAATPASIMLMNVHEQHVLPPFPQLYNCLYFAKLAISTPSTSLD